MKTVMQQTDAFRQYMKRMKAFDEAAGLLYWDMRTGAPRKGIEARSEVLGVLSAELFKMSVAPEMGEFIDYFQQSDVNVQLDEVTRRSIEECAKDYERSKKVPAALYEEYVSLTSQAESVWEEAKAQANFAMFQPYLDKVIDYNKQFVDLWGYEGHKYNTLLDMYEPGITVAQLDPLFGGLRDRIVPLLRKIEQSPHQPDISLIMQTFGKTEQKQFCLFMLTQIGYDFEAGRLDESSHPFATGLNLGDVRITTRYAENDMSGALFGTIHEFGHALYDQNISPELAGTVLCNGTSMGIHESQSRFWENIVARSKPFWRTFFPALQSHFPQQFASADVDTYYRAVNHVQPSLIRTESDELTYNLHVMVRYELEKAIFSDQLATADLPQAWNEKYKEYLGVVPPHDGVGVLQDVHWAAGLFGYFPSYALGNMYAAQLTNVIQRDIPHFEGLIEEGNFAPIRQWLHEHIHRHGKMFTPGELLLKVSGQTLRADELVQDLTDKYTEIYKQQ
jgi:carboxypeptidase Taq